MDDNGNAEKVKGKALDDLVYLQNQSNSVYAVVETKKITTQYISADGSDYLITVEYGPEALIPDTATLHVFEIDPESKEYETCLTNAYKKISHNRVISDARFFDISIMNNGKEIEPASDVSVKIAYNTPLRLEKKSELMAVHFTEDGVELNREVKNAKTEAGGSEVTFKQGSFSTTGTLITDVSMLKNGSNYVIVSEYNGKYYAATSNSSAGCGAQEIALSVDGTTVTFDGKTVVPNNCLWNYSNSTLRNQSSKRYLTMRSNSTMTENSAATLTFQNGSDGRIRVRRNNYYYLYSNGDSFGRTTTANNAAAQLYFIEYNKSGEYTIRFHYIDVDGNEIKEPVDRVMNYSEAAVDLHRGPFVEEIEGYSFRVSRYGNWEGDRFHIYTKSKRQLQRRDHHQPEI